MFINISDWVVGAGLPSSFSVKDLHPSYEALIGTQKKCRDARNGSSAIKKMGDVYLPRLDSQVQEKDAVIDQEKEDDYNNYKERAIFYGATGQTVDAFIGMLLSKPINYNGEETLINKIKESEAFKNSSQNGDSFEALIKHAVDEVLTVNRFGILEDYPVNLNPDGSVKEMSKLDAEKSAINSYSVGYKAEQIINWGWDYINGRKVMTFFVLQEKYYDTTESITKPTERNRWRILLLSPMMTNVREDENGELLAYDTEYVYKMVVVREKPGTGAVEIEAIMEPLKNGKRLNKIPFWVINTLGNRPDELLEPEILDLVEVNLGHYRNSADYENELHKVSIKTAVFPGWEDDDGSPCLGGATSCPPDQKPFILEATAKSGLSDEMKAKEERMAILGAQMLAQKGRYVQAAETAQIQSKGENSILSAMSSVISEIFSDILTFKLTWSNVIAEGETVNISLTRDYYNSSIDQTTLAELLKALQAGTISFDVYYYNMNRLNMYPEDWDIEKELKAINDTAIAGGMDELMATIDTIRMEVSQLKKGGGPAPAGNPEKKPGLDDKAKPTPKPGVKE